MVSEKSSLGDHIRHKSPAEPKRISIIISYWETAVFFLMHGTP